MAVAEKTGNSPSQLFGLTIGSVVVAGTLGAGAVPCGAYNPAVAIGLDVSSASKGFGEGILYTFVELAGGDIAAVLFTIVRGQEFGDEEKYGLAISSASSPAHISQYSLWASMSSLAVCELLFTLCGVSWCSM